MSATELNRLSLENDYLKRRCAQLQGDVEDLGSQVTRLNQQLERSGLLRTPAGPPKPFGN